MPQPTEPCVQQYFDQMIQQKLNEAPIKCGFAGESKGKALYAARGLKAGQLIWSERPFAAIQHKENKAVIDCCDHCLVALIDSKDAWHRVESANDGATQNVATFADFKKAIDLLQKRSGKSNGESYFSVYRLAKNMVQCECGVLYCSPECQKAAYDEQHAILCTHSDNNATPMGLFINHTLETNEIFQLAAKVIARVLSRFISTQDLEQARLPVDACCKLPWWEFVISENDVQEGKTLEQQRAVFRNVMGKTLLRLKFGLRDNLTRLQNSDELHGLSADFVMRACADVLSVDFFGGIVGMFEMNNHSITIDHPFHVLSLALLGPNADSKTRGIPSALLKVKNALAQYTEKKQDDSKNNNKNKNKNNEDEDGDDGDFVGMEGTGLFPTICAINHNCDPNCRVRFLKDGTAEVYAVETINAGDELSISYIDVDVSVEEREERLRGYQFRCQCARCEQERNA